MDPMFWKSFGKHISSHYLALNRGIPYLKYLVDLVVEHIISFLNNFHNKQQTWQGQYYLAFN